MSFHVLEHVRSRSQSKGPSRMVLFCLAARANDDWEAWPTLDRIASEAGISKRTVMRCLNHLVAIGELEVTTGRGRNHSNRYRILQPGLALVSGDNSVGNPVDEKRMMTESQRMMTEQVIKGDSCVTQKDRKDNEYTARDDLKNDDTLTPFPHECDNGWQHHTNGTVTRCVTCKAVNAQ